MTSTNPRQLRAQLKDYLDLAANEPVRIQRRSGESFILINEERFAELQNEVLSLQRRLLGMSQALEAKSIEYKPGDKSRAARFRKKESPK